MTLYHDHSQDVSVPHVLNRKLAAMAAALLLPTIASGNPTTTVSHGRFQNVGIYSPSGAPASVALLISGAEGWNGSADALARELSAQNALVIGVDFPQFAAKLNADPAQCVFPDGDLENLSHFVQAYMHNPKYIKPLLVGIGGGAAFAYSVLAQSPKNTFAGALTLGFCARPDAGKALCKGPGSSGGLSNPWVALQGEDPGCPVRNSAAIVAGIRGAAVASLPHVNGGRFSGNWTPPVLAAYAKLASANSATRAAAPAALSDLPIIEVPAAAGGNTDTFAIIMSGDGGWAGLDQDVAAALSAKGIPVVGLDSLRYYWTARTPQGLATDTDRMIRYYQAHFGRRRVLLIGYSQGADVLPFAVNRLPAASRDAVALTALMGMSEHAVFEFHLSSWIADDNSGPATLPEVNRITGIPVLCIYGEGEPDTLCPKLDAKKVTVVMLKGGHHFDGDYAGLTREIMAAAKL